MTEMTGVQARALAALVHELRQDWDAQGVLAALHDARVKGDATTVAIAAIRAASSTGNRTPAVIALDGPHWREAGSTTAVLGPRSPRCTVEGHEFELAHNCPRCKWDAAVEADLATRVDAPLVNETQAHRNAHGARTVLDAAPIDVRRLASGERDSDD